MNCLFENMAKLFLNEILYLINHLWYDLNYKIKTDLFLFDFKLITPLTLTLPCFDILS